ncbi:extracellular solute-binding protein [Paenibacillus sp. GD4]|uniref:extracellular solute-binding protein n=1 Tax=Paenibacillus sp. GD4 TaxID=3068890 RepID=UPI0027966DC6|nr:extracellular solute-binding protein [Paenibacillus sp. GD4]MDQ1913476.1 extracellular solute-binding protein [Paenibacillus sp. GD4]
MVNRKGAAVSMTALLLAAAAAGCSGGDAPGAGTGSGGADSSKRIKVSMMYPLYAEPPQKTEAWKLIEDKFNIEYEPIAVPNNSYNDKLKVTLASGDMPDLILWTNYPDPELVKYVNQGAFLPLDDLIKASPNIMKTPQDIFDNVKIEGKLYSVPRTRALNRSAVMIRKDWLDNLGLPVPKTVDDLYKTALAFTNNDPDKNGKNDTFGIAMGENLSHLDALFMAFDTGSGWRKMEDGSLMNDVITPGRKQALEWLRRLYADGGLDKDFAVLKNTQVWEKLEGGKAGILIGGQTSDYARYVENLGKIDPKANLIMIAPPTGPSGKSGYGETSGFFGQWLIPAKTDKEKAKRLMQVLDWQAGDEAYKMKRYGVEGVHHTMENGKPKLNADKYKADGVDNLIPHNPYDPYSYVVLTAPEAVQKAQKDNLDFVAKLGIKNPALSFVAPTSVEKQSDLNKLKDETFVKIVMGKAPLEDFDKFTKEWLDKGGAQITKETNEWFKKQK